MDGSNRKAVVRPHPVAIRPILAGTIAHQMHCTRRRRLLEQESRLSDEVASEGNDVELAKVRPGSPSTNATPLPPPLLHRRTLSLPTLPMSELSPHNQAKRTETLSPRLIKRSSGFTCEQQVSARRLAGRRPPPPQVLPPPPRGRPPPPHELLRASREWVSPLQREDAGRPAPEASAPEEEFVPEEEEEGPMTQGDHLMAGKLRRQRGGRTPHAAASGFELGCEDPELSV